MFRGSIVALVTPLKNDMVDEAALKKIVDIQIAEGTHGIVPCGTTGESPTLTYEEHCRVTEIVINQTNGRVPVIAGTGSNSTHETLYFTEHAKKYGADGALIVTPYYNKPTQEGMYQHFKKIAENVDIPIILYNVPGRTGVNLLPETVVRLAQIPNIVALKDASGIVSNADRIIKDAPKDFTILCGDDGLTYPMMALGAQGVISVVANVLPRKMSIFCNHLLAKDYDKAKEFHYEMLEIFSALFVEGNPVPVKKAMYMMGLLDDELRMPLVPLGESHLPKLIKILKDLGVKLPRG